MENRMIKQYTIDVVINVFKFRILFHIITLIATVLFIYYNLYVPMILVLLYIIGNTINAIDIKIKKSDDNT